MSPPPSFDCSVCVANYNGEHLLAECLDSVLRQRGSLRTEIIVHDDASSDGSLQLLRSRYPQVQVIESRENVGFCLANNRMAKAARGRYLLLLNNDAALAPDALETLMDAAEHSSVPGILTLPQYDWESGELVDRGCLLDPFYNPIPNRDPERQDVAMVIGACLWLPRTLWFELGGFPSWFGSIAEDMHLCCVARLWGRSVQVTRQSSYRHRQGKSFGGNRVSSGQLVTTYRRRALSERNKTFVLYACTPGRLLWLLPVHLLMLLAEGLALVVIRREIRIWREVYGAALSGLWARRAWIRQERRRVQRGRRVSTKTYLRGFSIALRKAQLLRRHGLPRLD